jgi:hypothetical protein
MEERNTLCRRDDAFSILINPCVTNTNIVSSACINPLLPVDGVPLPAAAALLICATDGGVAAAIVPLVAVAEVYAEGTAIIGR